MRKLRYQIFAIVYVGMLILAVFLYYGQYQRSLQLSERLVLERLQAIATTLAPRIDGEVLQDIQNRFPLAEADTNLLVKDSSFQQLTETLFETFKTNHLKTPIYTLLANESMTSLRLGVSSHGAASYGLSYESHIQEHLDIYSTGGTIKPYTDEWGVWLSAMVPIKTTGGKQIAALEVDFPFDDFIMYAEDDLQSNITTAAVIFLIVGILLFFFMRIALNRDEERQLELQVANNEVRKKKEDLESSIRYAARMQAILQPSESEIAEFFSHHLLLDLPKDTVSGDFIWFRKLDENRAWLAVADCTGHGVPGAFMSIMGHNLLSDAIDIEHLETPDRILNYVDKRVCAVFGCEKSASDGMDMAICLIDKKSNNLLYAGARRPLTILKNGEETVVGATRRSIGEQISDYANAHFETHTINLSPHSRYYMYSDGMQDQFGGEKEKKIGHARLRKWFNSLPREFGSNGRAKLTSLLHEWKGQNEQVDDILVFGFSIG